jgi:hypothetical protein
VALWPHTTARPARSLLLLFLRFYLTNYYASNLIATVYGKYTSVRLFIQAPPVLFRFSGRIYKIYHHQFPLH